MALLKTIQLPENGVTVTYHNIPICSKGFRNKMSASQPMGELVYEGKIKYVNMQVASYTSADIREAGKNAISHKNYICEDTNPSFATFFSDTVLAAEGMNLEKACYDYLKSLPEFAGASNHP